MAVDVSASLPELILAPGSTITVELDDASAKITKLNVYGFTPARVVVPEFEVLPPLLSYGAEQQPVLAAFDWTPIAAAAVIALPAYFGVLVSLLNRRDLRTESGDSLGRVAERTHDLAAANSMMLTKINGDLHGKGTPEGEAVPRD